MTDNPNPAPDGKMYEKGDLAVAFENYRPVDKADFRELMASVGLSTETNVFTDGKYSHLVPFIVPERWGDGCAVVLGLTGAPFLIAHGHDCPRTLSMLDSMEKTKRGSAINLNIKDCASAETGIYAGRIDGEEMLRQLGGQHS